MDYMVQQLTNTAKLLKVHLAICLLAREAYGFTQGGSGDLDSNFAQSSQGALERLGPRPCGALAMLDDDLVR